MLQRELRLDQRVKTDKTILVVVVVGGDLGAWVIDRMIEVVEGHLGRKVEVKPRWLRIPRPVGEGQHRRFVG